MGTQIVLRDATADDFGRLGVTATAGMTRALAAQWDSRTIAVFGIGYPFRAGMFPLGFADVVPELPPAVGAALVLAGRRALRSFSLAPVLVLCDQAQPNAPRLLAALGFARFGDTPRGTVWRFAGRG